MLSSLNYQNNELRAQYIGFKWPVPLYYWVYVFRKQYTICAVFHERKRHSVGLYQEKIIPFEAGRDYLGLWRRLGFRGFFFARTVCTPLCLPATRSIASCKGDFAERSHFQPKFTLSPWFLIAFMLIVHVRSQTRRGKAKTSPIYTVPLSWAASHFVRGGGGRQHLSPILWCV